MVPIQVVRNSLEGALQGNDIVRILEAYLHEPRGYISHLANCLRFLVMLLIMSRSGGPSLVRTVECYDEIWVVLQALKESVRGNKQVDTISERC